MIGRDIEGACEYLLQQIRREREIYEQWIASICPPEDADWLMSQLDDINGRMGLKFEDP